MFRRSPEVEAVVRRYLAARRDRDSETMRNLHSSSEHARSIGSDSHEWYQGHEEVVAIQTVHWDEQPRAMTSLLRLEAFESGETGWAALEMDVAFADGETFRARQTIVLEIESGVWKIAQIHFSIPVANKVVDGVELTRTLSDLLTSMDTVEESTALNDAVMGTATLVFTDIVDSTVRSGSMGDQAWSDVLNRHFETARLVVETGGGSVVKTLGDGGMFVFPTGAAALSGSIRLQRSVEKSLGSEVSLRVGVHTGDVVQSHDDYIGLAVNKAARVAAAADGGQILVSETTVGMVNSNEYEFGPPISLELKGIPGTHALRPLLWN